MAKTLVIIGKPCFLIAQVANTQFISKKISIPLILRKTIRFISDFITIVTELMQHRLISTMSEFILRGRKNFYGRVLKVISYHQLNGHKSNIMFREMKQVVVGNERRIYMMWIGLRRFLLEEHL